MHDIKKLQQTLKSWANGMEVGKSLLKILSMKDFCVSDSIDFFTYVNCRHQNPCR